MYKKTEKKLNFLLDKLLLYTTLGKSHLNISYLQGQIGDVLKANKELLPISIQEKIIKLLPVTHSWVLLSAAFQSKNYQHLSGEIVKLLDLSDLYFSYDVIETLYKMGTYQYVDEIRPFAALSIDDFMPFSQTTYRTELNCDNLKWLNDAANKYIKRAGKLKEKHMKKAESYNAKEPDTI